MRFLTTLFCCLPLLVRAVTNSVPCDFLSISNAVAAANEGDTVLIAAGSCSISNLIVINRGKSFNIQGSGTNATHLTQVASQAFSLQSNSTNTFTVSDIDCINAASSIGFFGTGPNVPGTPLAGPVRLTRLQFTNIISTGLSIGYCGSFTLVDHCTFTIPQGAGNWICIRFYGNEFRSWTNLLSNPLGTTNANVVEDCVFINKSTNTPLEFFDGYQGCQVVVRHNYFQGPGYSGLHGYDSQVTSMRTLEVYNNVYTNIASYFFLSRGGVFEAFSNTIWCSDNIGLGPKLTYYRGCYGEYQGTYGYAGYDKTNFYTTNWVDGSSTDLSNVDLTLQHGNPTIGSGPAYTFTSNLSTHNAGFIRYVQLGASLAESITNLVSEINWVTNDAGTKWSIGTLTSEYGRGRDFRVTDYGTNYIVLHSVMDGTNAYGWPAAFQAGTLAITEYTNQPIVRYPCFQWSNVVHYANASIALAKWQRDFDTATNRPNYITNLLAQGRDYFDDAIATNYTPLVYPHPLNTGPGLQAAAVPAPTGNFIGNLNWK